MGLPLEFSAPATCGAAEDFCACQFVRTSGSRLGCLGAARIQYRRLLLSLYATSILAFSEPSPLRSTESFREGLFV